MSRTTRKHEAAGRHARRGPKNPLQSEQDKLKSNKQRRVNERAKLRKEFR